MRRCGQWGLQKYRWVFGDPCRTGTYCPCCQWFDKNSVRLGRRGDKQYLQKYRWVLSERCWAGGCVLTLPPVRLLLRTGRRVATLPGVRSRAGRTVRGTVRSNPKRSYLDFFRLFWKSRGKSTRGFGKNTRWLRLDLIEVSPGHFDPGPQGTRGESVGRRTARVMWPLDAAACNCFCVWLLGIGLCGDSSPLYLKKTTQEPSPWGEGAPEGRMRGSLKVSARFRQRKRRRSFFRRVATALDVSTSSDLASLGHLPLKGKAFLCASSMQQTATIPTKSKSNQPNFDASETERIRTTIVRVQRLPKAVNTHRSERP